MDKPLFRVCTMFCLVGACTFGVCRFACNRLGTSGSGSQLVQTTFGEYIDAASSSTVLEPRVETNYRRIQDKHAVVIELLADRLTLWEAATRIGKLDAEVPDIQDRLAHRYPGDSFQVALCREVIEQARSVLRVQAPEQLDKVVAKLEAELQSYLECEEDLCLP
jgi:hypothetical protein